MNQKSEWRAEYIHKPYAEFNNDNAEVTIFNFRTFCFAKENAYIWDTRHYNLSDLISLDLIQSHWSGNMIAHVFLSFGFANGERVAISIETRRKSNQLFSVWKGFFNHYDVIYVVADEIDLIGTRVNLRGEKVYIYPLDLNKDLITLLFVNYIDKLNEIKETNEKYHSMWNNCTTSIFKIAKKTYPDFKFNWQLLVSGYAFKYCAKLGFINEKFMHNRQELLPLDVIDKDFSEKIRR